MPLILYGSDGVTETFNTDNVSGGVIAYVRTCGPTETDTLYFSVFAGRTAYIVNMMAWASGQDIGVTVDTSLGYPRVTISAAPLTRRFALVVM